MHFMNNPIFSFKFVKSKFSKYCYFLNHGNKLFIKRSLSSTYNKDDNDKISVASSIINKASNILVMTGAGLSTPSGIPDFRSPGTGLYDNLQKFNLPYPEAIFDIHYFMMDPKPFFTLAQDLYPGIHYKPNIGHFFINLLHMKNKLQKIYTQNIDGLERLAGVPESKLIESHGTFLSASCTLCNEKHDAKQVRENIISGKTPIYCQINGCKGKVKPDIVFFGENLPLNFWEYEVDVHFTDVLLVIGTSLEVYPFANIADAVSRKIPRILINRSVVGSFGERPNDLILTGDLISIINELVLNLGWTKDLDSITVS